MGGMMNGIGILDTMPKPDPAMAGILGLLGQQNLSAPMIEAIIRHMQMMQPTPVPRRPVLTTGVRG